MNIKMKNFSILLTFLNLFFFNSLYSAQLIFEVGGKFEVTHFYQVSSDYSFMTIQNSWTMTTNTPHVAYGTCSGIVKTKSKEQIYDLMCNGKYKDYQFFAAFDYRASGDVLTAGTSEFSWISGTGPWSELVGVKCLGALVQLGQEHYIWKGKCNVSEKTFERFSNFTD